MTCNLIIYSVDLGGIFEHAYHGQEVVFKYAVEKINARRDLLPYTKLTYDIRRVPQDDSFLASKKGPYKKEHTILLFCMLNISLSKVLCPKFRKNNIS